MQQTRSQALVQTNQKGAFKLPVRVPAGRAALTCWRARSAAACPPPRGFRATCCIGASPLHAHGGPAGRCACPERSAPEEAAPALPEPALLGSTPRRTASLRLPAGRSLATSRCPALETRLTRT